MPRVSVIMPVYNMEATIGRALDSVLAQTFTDYDIICVDDGSTDGTPAALAQFGTRLCVITQTNRGTSATRNVGARRARSDYLAFLDADDAWREDKLARSVAALDANPDCVLGYSDSEWFGTENGKARWVAEATPPPSLDELLSRICSICLSTVVVRREAFERSGGFRDDLKAWEDVELFLRLRELGPFVHIPQRLASHQYDAATKLGKALRKNADFHHLGKIIHQRYGRRARGLLACLARHKVNVLSHAGVLALARGDRGNARQCFKMALGWNPYRVKTYLRLARTFMPARIVAALSGRDFARALSAAASSQEGPAAGRPIRDVADA
jgi:glycosyltransferase involved in cell wall biosynthesis